MPNFCSTSNSKDIVFGLTSASAGGTSTVAITAYTTPYLTALSGQTPAVTSCLPSGSTLATCGWPATTSTSGTTTTTTVSATSTQIQAQVDKLLGQAGQQPQPDLTVPMSVAAGSDPAAIYATASSALRKAINNEYCYYYKAYNFAFPTLLQKIVATNPVTPQAELATLQTNCLHINRILVQILQVLQGIASSRSASVDSYYNTNGGTLTSLNADINSIQDKLRNDMNALRNKNLDTDLKAAMVDYTTEKNLASRNMMAIYGFLNIVAVGMLVYLYRSSK